MLFALFPRIAPLVLGLFSLRAVAQTDSTALLFEESQVRSYNLEFYDADWESLLASHYAAGDGGYIKARFSDGTITFDSVGVRYKGNSSYTATGSSPKKPFKIKFDAYVDSLNYYGVESLNFSNGVADPSMMREVIAYSVARQYMPAPRANYAVISAQGQQIGLYTQVEPVDKLFLDRWFTHKGNNLYKAADNGATMGYLGRSQDLYNTSYELKTNETTNDWTRLVQMLYMADTATDANFQATLAGVLDVDLAARFFALNMVLSHFDSYTGSGRNFYLYDDSAKGRFVLIPWDMNQALGSYSYGWSVVNQDLLAQSNLADRPLLKRFLANDSLRYRYLYYVKKMIAEFAATSAIQARIDVLKPIIASYVSNDPSKLYSEEAFLTNLSSAWRTGPTSSIPGLIDFSTQRNAALLAQLGNYLPADYVAGTQKKFPGFTGSLRLQREGDGWTVLVPASFGSYRLEWFAIDGTCSGQVGPHQGDLQLYLPVGTLAMRVVGQGYAQNFLIHNSQER